MGFPGLGNFTKLFMKTLYSVVNACIAKAWIARLTASGLTSFARPSTAVNLPKPSDAITRDCSTCLGTFAFNFFNRFKLAAWKCCTIFHIVLSSSRSPGNASSSADADRKSSAKETHAVFFVVASAYSVSNTGVVSKLN